MYPRKCSGVASTYVRCCVFFEIKPSLHFSLLLCGLPLQPAAEHRKWGGHPGPDRPGQVDAMGQVPVGVTPADTGAAQEQLPPGKGVCCGGQERYVHEGGEKERARDHLPV